MARPLQSALSMHESDLTSRALRGALLGTAVADALGLPFEGLSHGEIHVGELDRFRLWGRTGFVSDDTQQSALVAAAVLEANFDLERARARFRRGLVAWLLSLPFGIGWATLRACLRLLCLRTRSGVRSAGNGAAMRAAPLGVLFADDDARRRAAARLFATVTHTDARAVDGALYVAELAALCTLQPAHDRGTLALAALRVVRHPELREAIEGAVLSAGTGHEPRPLENRGYVVHTLEIACHAFVRAGHAYLPGVRAAILRGGDTDTNAAIVGAWLGILHGPDALPARFVAALGTGPCGERALSALARGERWRHVWLGLVWRNLALFPVVLAHGLGRLWRRPGAALTRAAPRVVQSRR